MTWFPRSIRSPNESSFGQWEVILNIMFRAIGFGLILYFISVMLTDAFHSFERAAVATFDTIEAAALVSQNEIEKKY